MAKDKSKYARQFEKNSCFCKKKILFHENVNVSLISCKNESKNSSQYKKFFHFSKNEKFKKAFSFSTPVGVHIRIRSISPLFVKKFPYITVDCVQASTKNAVSDTEKREKKMLEKKLTEMEEELKVTTTSLLFSFPHRRQCKMSSLKKKLPVKGL